jgi:DNA-binding NtrC family response regulator
LPGLDGIALHKEAKKIDPDLSYIIVTGKGTINSAVTAMRMGVDDFITKPFDREQLLISVERTLNQNRMKRELRSLRAQIIDKFGMENIVGKSRIMMRLLDTARKVARSEATILIEGESGTGKEILAKSIHYLSTRANGPLVAIDCASLPLELLQSELFGHIKGSFTGAMQNRRGLFEEAREGSIFLDEIGEIPASIQLSLLRVLQEREIRPVGSDKSVPVNVRIISASNRRLKEAVEKGHFRRDLYYRLAVITLEIPPLRERKEDIPALCQFFLERYSQRNRKNVTGISPGAMNLLLNYRWEGNVRELENVIERAVVLTEGMEITPDLLPEEIQEKAGMGMEIKFDYQNMSLKEICHQASTVMERDAIVKALKKAGGNRKRAAEILGISRSSLYNKLKELKMSGKKTDLGVKG